MSSAFSDDSSMDEETTNGLIVLKTYGNRGPGLPDIVLACGSVTDYQSASVAAIVNAANEGCLGGGGVDGAITAAGGPNLARDRLALPLLGGAATRKRKNNEDDDGDDDDDDGAAEQKIAAVLFKKQEQNQPSDVAGEEKEKEEDAAAAAAGKDDEKNAAAEAKTDAENKLDESTPEDVATNETQDVKTEDAVAEAEKGQSIETVAKNDDDSKPAAKEEDAPYDEKIQTAENQKAKEAAADANPKVFEKENGEKEEEQPKGADEIVEQDQQEKKKDGDDASVNMLDSDDDNDSDNVFAPGARCRTGSAVITGPGDYGDLQVPFVIHAVGPNFWEWVGREDEAFAKLESAYSDSLQLAAEHNIAEVAFSLLSAGVFRGRQSMGRVLMHGIKAVGEWRPPAVVAQEAEETDEWTEITHNSQESSLKKVFFCAFTEKECMILLKAGRYVFERDANA